MLRHLVTIIMLALPVMSYAQTVVEVRDGDIAGDVVWTKDNTYVLIGRVFVEEGETLTIEEGTVIRGRASEDPNQSAVLVVARGAQIFAEGTATQPIIFTAEADDLADPADLGPTDRGLWGGVVILGRATVNTATGEGNVEGIDVSENRGIYGGGAMPDDEDDSGVLRYVSIRHGGTAINPNDEINGLTLAGVGRGTTVEHVEVFANFDDGVEWFGGTVNTKYLAVAFAGDDGFDYDEGWTGWNQFWFLLQGADAAGSGGEHDGGTDPETGEPYAIPVVYNATYIGAGTDAGEGEFALVFRDNAGGKYYNSIFTAFSNWAVLVEDLDSGEDSYARFEAEQLRLEHNIFFGFGAGDAAADIFQSVNADEEMVASKPALVAYLEANNAITDPMLAGVSRAADGGLDPRPMEGSPALLSEVGPYPDGDFFTDVDYIGAFANSVWVSGWTALSAYGILDPEVTNTPNEEEHKLPERIVLEQNFPNPFNPSTTIAFQLDRAQAVRLAVYDLLGREVAVLIDGLQPTGEHEVRFDARELASGTYLYRLQTEAGVVTKMMTLMK